jgi:hypothetical protein
MIGASPKMPPPDGEKGIPAGTFFLRCQKRRDWTKSVVGRQKSIVFRQFMSQLDNNVAFRQ